MDSKSTRLLRDLRAALLKAMTESREMQLALDRLREFGWSAYLVIDESPTESAPARPPLALPAADRPALEGEVEMDPADLSFLRALGIDPRSDGRGF